MTYHARDRPGLQQSHSLDRARAGAFARSHPNVLTFLGLVINIGAAALLAVGQFRWAGAVIIGAGLFDMVDGRVARETNRVTRFGGFFDSVLDRYSDLALLVGSAGLVRLHQPVRLCGADGHRDDRIGDGQLRSGARGKHDPDVQGRLHGAAGAGGAADHRRAVRPHGRRCCG